MRIFVSGASRGIGLEFVRQYLSRGEDVVAAARDPQVPALQQLSHNHPGRLQRCTLDVGSDRDALALGEQIAAPLHVLINSAGIMDRASELSRLDLAEADRIYQVDALGPLRVTRALLPQLFSAGGAKVLHISSDLGSIGDNTAGGYYAYRMAKAALNMASRCLAHELRPHDILSAVISPGWVQTDMGGQGAPLPVTESIAAMVRTIDRLTMHDSGGFFHRDGRQIPW